MAILRVAPHNSTVNGRRANPHHRAHDWFDGWMGLAFRSRHVFVDGRKDGYSGEYLHVPLSRDTRSYRVRCRFRPGNIYRGRKVLTASCKKNGMIWYWSLSLGK